MTEDAGVTHGEATKVAVETCVVGVVVRKADAGALPVEVVPEVVGRRLAEVLRNQAAVAEFPLERPQEEGGDL